MLHVEVLYFIYVAGNFLTKSIHLVPLWKSSERVRDPTEIPSRMCTVVCKKDHPRKPAVPPPHSRTRARIF